MAGKKNEGSGGDHAEEGGNVVPFDAVAEIKDGKDTEDGQGDNFLGDFELRGRVNVAAPTVSGDLEDVFKEGDAPACEYDEPDGLVFEFKVSVPGEGHEDVRAGQEDEWEKTGLGEVIHESWDLWVLQQLRSVWIRI